MSCSPLFFEFYSKELPKTGLKDHAIKGEHIPSLLSYLPLKLETTTFKGV